MFISCLKISLNKFSLYLSGKKVNNSRNEKKKKKKTNDIRKSFFLTNIYVFIPKQKEKNRKINSLIEILVFFTANLGLFA